MAGGHEEIYRRLGLLEQSQAVVQTELRGLRADVQRMVKVVVDGNGDSLVTRLRLLEETTEQLQTLRKENRKALWGIVAAIAGGIAGWLGGLVQHLFN